MLQKCTYFNIPFAIFLCPVQEACFLYKVRQVDFDIAVIALQGDSNGISQSGDQAAVLLSCVDWFFNLLFDLGL